MKLLTIIYDVAIEASLSGLLEELEVTTWTKSTGYVGAGEAGTKLSSPIWPGTNNQMLIAGDEAMVREIAASVRALQAEFKLRPGIFMYVQDVEEV